jgi:hypothetical protein
MGEGDFNSEIDSNELPDWNNKKEQTKSYKEIVQSAIEKCRVEISKPMRINSTMSKTKTGQLISSEPEDQREVFSQAVLSLKLLLFFTFDDQATKIITECEENKKRSFDKYFKIYLETEDHYPHSDFAKRSGYFHPKSQMKPFYEDKIADYKLEQNYIIYQELLLLYKRRNELSKKRTMSIY